MPRKAEPRGWDATRLIPVPGRRSGEHVSFGGLFGESAVLAVNSTQGSDQFVRFGGRIAAPIQSLRN